MVAIATLDMPSSTAARNRDIVRAWRLGATEADLAREHGISRQRVDQIVQRRQRDERRRERGLARLLASSRSGREELAELLEARRALNARIRSVCDEIRTAEQEVQSARIDELLGV